MYDNARGGNDTLIGGDGAFFNFFLADASDMYGNTRGGNDTLIGGRQYEQLTSTATPTSCTTTPAAVMTRLIGGGAFSINYFFGDAVEHARQRSRRR